jgi:hypothetical protein
MMSLFFWGTLSVKWFEDALDLARDLRGALHEEISNWINLLRQIWLPLMARLARLPWVVRLMKVSASWSVPVR